MVDIVRVLTGKFKGQKAYIVSREFNADRLLVTPINGPASCTISVYGEDVEFIRSAGIHKGTKNRG